jgi:hypothetical protein
MDDCGVMSAMTATNDGKRKFENLAEQSFLGAQGCVLHLIMLLPYYALLCYDSTAYVMMLVNILSCLDLYLQWYYLQLCTCITISVQTRTLKLLCERSQILLSVCYLRVTLNC